MKTLQQSVNELNELIKQFRFEEALDTFYDENVVTVENEGQPITGLPGYKMAAKKYIDSVNNYKAILKNIIIIDGVSACEWHYSFDHKEWGKWDKGQISVQRWKNGKIVHERHHYNLD